MPSFKTKYRAKCYGLHTWRLQSWDWWWPFWVSEYRPCRWYGSPEEAAAGLATLRRYSDGAGTVVPL